MGQHRWRREPGQSLIEHAAYRVCRAAVLAATTLLYRLRVSGSDRVPASGGGGGALLIANHASHLDPPLIGVAVKGRTLMFLARSGLFKFGPFAALIRALGAIPLKENEGDLGAMKRAIEELKRGRLVLIFPEGTRSPDGSLREFKRGAWLLISRAKCDVIPVHVEGAFEAWPRSRALPRVFSGKPIRVRIGEAIDYERELAGLDAERGLNLLRERVALAGAT